VRLDSANRSFLVLTGIALLLGMYVLWGAIGTVLAPLVVSQISHGGLGGLLGAGRSVGPAFLFVAAVALGLALGVRSVSRQILVSRRLAHRVRGLTLPVPSALALAATDVGLGGRVVLVDAPERFSFAYGALTPRVAVSRGLLEAVSALELRAVLEHEHYHVRNLDPLKALVAQALSAVFFVLPAFESLSARYLAGRELAADRQAVAACGHRPLVGALLQAVRGPDWGELDGVAPIGGSDRLEARVAQLETGAEPKLPALGMARTTLSLAGATLLAAAFLASVSSFGGATAISRATGTGLSAALLSGLICAAPFAGAGTVAYWILARRARRPLSASHRH
jgi:Zn-dependent protease with chaperone function